MSNNKPHIMNNSDNTTNPNDMIRLENVNKFFNKRKKNEIHVIDHTTISFPEKGLIALLGPSGCGKTTLLNTIGGLDKIGTGQIFVDDERITKRSAGKIDKIRNAKIGYIFQNYNLMDNQSVFENVAVVLKMIGIKDKEEISRRVEYALNLVGMYRYRNRFADMLSGGERQRVGIARAIVKNPSIIIADEPTGNLDSKNSLEVMNIIKSISKEKLVIIVTHEEKLAEFYADRTVKLLDGKVISDEENIHDKDLDYRMDHRKYLKDMQQHDTLGDDNCKIDIYSDNNEKIQLNIIADGDNIYLQCLTDNKHIEVVDEHSAIEIVDDHYREMTKEEQEKHNFNPDKLGDPGDGRHSSIISFFGSIVGGFKTVFEYTILKKILLAGFFISAIFIVYAISNIAGVTTIKDSKFVNDNKEYITVKASKVSVKDFKNIEKNDTVKYALPGSGKATFTMDYDDYLQTSLRSAYIGGSLSSNDSVKEEDLIAGELPKDKYDVVIDKLVYDRYVNEYQEIKQAGIGNAKDLIGKKLKISNMPEFTVVGITNTESPCIYANSKLFINIMANGEEEGQDPYMMGEEEPESSGESSVVDYKLMKKKVKITKGRAPKDDYEVAVNKDYAEEMPINKTIKEKINGKKLKVVGHYEAKEDGASYMLVSSNTIKIDLIKKNKNVTVCPATDKAETLASLESEGLNVVDIYKYDKDKYVKKIWPQIKSTVIMALIIMVISFIEIFLIMRASFLSRIREIGTLRAIGVKKSDIYKIFMGETVAITTLASLPGYILMSYIMEQLSHITYLKDMFIMDGRLFIIGILAILVFNVIVGLLPVFFTMRKTPAAILARTDIN